MHLALPSRKSVPELPGGSERRGPGGQDPEPGKHVGTNLQHATRVTKLVDLVIPVVPPNEPPAWPTSGMIELRTTTDLGFVIPLEASVAISTIAMTFSGSSIVAVTINGENGTQSCRVNLVTTALGC